MSEREVERLKSLLKIEEQVNEYHDARHRMVRAYEKHCRLFNQLVPDNGWKVGETIEHFWRDLEKAKLEAFNEEHGGSVV